MLQTGNISTNYLDISSNDLSYETSKTFVFVIYTGICIAFEIFGVITNIINSVCFVKQGFNEPINISLLGLAISDTFSLISSNGICIIITLMHLPSNLYFDFVAVLSLVFGHPHMAFTRLSSWITALITLERCLCIVAPLKVKEIITPRRVCIIVVFVFIILIFSEAPVYFVSKLDMIYVPGINVSMLGLVPTDDREKIVSVSFLVNNFILPFAAFIIITVCTIILVISLSKTSAWRKTSVKSSDVSNRNQRVAKMVTMISTLFIFCFIPFTIIMLTLAFVPDLSVGGRSVNKSVLAFGFGLLLESVNSSSNIFIYYYMSSKYRNTFHDIFSNIRAKYNKNILKGI